MEVAVRDRRDLAGVDARLREDLVDVARPDVPPEVELVELRSRGREARVEQEDAARVADRVRDDDAGLPGIVVVERERELARRQRDDVHGSDAQFACPGPDVGHGLPNDEVPSVRHVCRAIRECVECRPGDTIDEIRATATPTANLVSW